MVYDVIAGSILLAFGLLVIYFSVESKEKDSTFLVYLLIGIACAVGGGWIIITRITLAALLTKLAGLILAAVGFFLVVQFPDIDQYQRPEMGKTGVLIGLVLLIFGAYLLFFG